MSKWLLSVIGVVFMGVLFDLLYPNGKTNTICKSIFGIFAVFVMISPILNIDINEFVSKVSNDSVLVDNLNSAKEQALKSKIESYLVDSNINGVSVEIDSNLNLNEYVIKNIYVDTTNLVLTENITNINKYEVIQDLISNVVDIDKIKVIVYG